MKKENFFVRVWKKLCKFCKDTAGELKKVVWMSKSDLYKTSKLVICTVAAVAVVIAVVDLCASSIINTLAGWIG